MVVEVAKEEEFDKCLKEAGSKLVVVDFHALWCGPCKMISPKIAEMEKELPNVVFLKVDVDELEEVAAKYEISAMPTFKLFKDGKMVATVVGASVEKLKKTIKENM